MREWLKEKRCAAGLTMKQIAEKLNMTESYYSYIENGNRQKKMDIPLASKLSVVFGIPLETIAELEKQEDKQEERK